LTIRFGIHSQYEHTTNYCLLFFPQNRHDKSVFIF
jgi:hypothetical protein